MITPVVQLKLLPRSEYAGINRDDPIRFYSLPLIGRMYRRRVEMCLAECRGGERVLEVGFGSGVTFLNLHESYREIHGLDLTADVASVARVFRARGIETDLRNGSVLAMPYANDTFDTVLLISILEHLKPAEQEAAFGEIARVLKPGGQVVYGVPVERKLMVFAFRVLGYNIREHHFSTEKQVSAAADAMLERLHVRAMDSLLGSVYQVGHFVKSGSARS
jgi:ubiquinone/menaquinone biosynthesis C-methylase UbiE